LWSMGKKEEPQPRTMQEFESLCKPNVPEGDVEEAKRNNLAGDGDEDGVKERISEINKPEKKANYFVRLSELLHEHSSTSALCVVTLPVPRVSIHPRKYMAYLEMMSKGMPPCLLMRGNNQSVLTFYS